MFERMRRPLAQLLTLLSLRPFIVHGESMEPNVAPGDYLLVSRLAYLLISPQRGDVVVLRDPASPKDLRLKRIVALPGERVRIEQGAILVHDRPLREPYLALEMGASPEEPQQWSLGGDSYLVLGDNRGYSRDSRVFGPIERRLIVGKAWLRYWPRHAWGPVSQGECPEKGIARRDGAWPA